MFNFSKLYDSAPEEPCFLTDEEAAAWPLPEWWFERHAPSAAVTAPEQPPKDPDVPQ